MIPARLLAWLGSRRATWAAFLLIVLLSLPALYTGVQHDDFIHQTLLHELPSAQRRSPDELYCFVGGPHSRPAAVAPPWWQAPDHSVCFFRPLSSLSLAIDHTLLMRPPTLAHGHALLWFLLLCGAVYAVARRLLPPVQARLALVIYGVSSFGISGVAWLAARHSLISATLATFSVLLYVGGRADSRPLRTTLGLLGLAFSLLAGESALSAFAFVAAYEFFLTQDAPQRRAAWLGLAASGALAYVIWYGRAGYGMRNVGLYLDPLRQPGPFLRELPSRLLALLSEALFGLPSTLWHAPTYRPLYWLLGGLGLAVLVAIGAVSRVGRDPEVARRLRFLSLGALLAAIPMTTAVLGGRLLLVPGLGLSLLFAILLHPPTASEPAAPRLLRGLLVLLAGLLFVVNPVFRVAQSLSLRQIAEAELRIPNSFLAPCDTADHYYLLGSDDFTVAMFAPFLLHEQLRRKEWRQITLASSDITIEALSEKTLRLRSQPPGLLLGGFVYELTRPSHLPLRPGQRVPIGLGEIHIEEASPRGISSLRLELSVPHSGGSICWLRFDGTHLSPLQFTSRNVQEKQIVPYIKGAAPF